MEELYAKAAELAGRPIEVAETTDGKFIALYLRFEKSPPPKGDTPEEALKLFIDFITELKKAEPKLEEG